jgi:hypothetical protein
MIRMLLVGYCYSLHGSSGSANKAQMALRLVMSSPDLARGASRAPLALKHAVSRSPNGPKARAGSSRPCVSGSATR